MLNMQSLPLAAYPFWLASALLAGEAQNHRRRARS